MTSTPEAATIDLRDNLTTATSSAAGPLPTFSKHLYSDTDGLFPAQLNSWETKVHRNRDRPRYDRRLVPQPVTSHPRRAPHRLRAR